MSSLQKMIAAVIAVGATVSGASAAALTIDNFESYTPGPIASSSTSIPWLRFGSGDTLYASTATSSVLSGTQSGVIPVAIVAANGSETVRKNYGTATDFSSYATATVLSKSLATTASTATLQLSIADATTTYLSTVALPELTTAQTFTFSLNPSAFTLAAGTDTYATVLGGAISIGFRIGSTTGSTAETIALDDFAVQTASTPEPATLGLVGVGTLVTLGRRR